MFGLLKRLSRGTQETGGEDEKGDEECAARAAELIASGRQAEAESLLDERVATFPADDAAWFLRGELAEQAGHGDRALDCYGRASALAPRNVSYAFARGYLLQDMGRFADAAESYRRVLELDESHAKAHNNLGCVLEVLGNSVEARTHYERALELNPDFAHAHYNLGNNLKEVGQPEAALHEMERALALSPENPDWHGNAASVCHRLGRVAEALRHYERQVQLSPDSAQGHSDLGLVLHEQGLQRQAEAHFRRALSLAPGDAVLFSNLLLSLNYRADLSPEEVFQAHLDWGRRFGGQEQAMASWNVVPDPTRRLRIGYVSPDFRSHPVAVFMSPILAHHDPDHVEVVCYSDVLQEDGITRWLRGQVPHWRDSSQWEDERLAAQIVQDRIDILVDLAGHTGRNRLRLFARKPAPVQVSYLGYLNTTGLSAMDYRLTDRVASPPGWAERYHVEKLAYLPHCQWCFAPPTPSPEVGPLPARRNGYVTFGSFHNLVKMTEPVVETWAEILRGLPTARLFMMARGMEEARERLRERFVALGIEAGRILFQESRPYQEYLASYGEVDVCLDTFPYTGGTTTCESLWMGVPVLTCEAESVPGRGGASLMHVMDMSEWVAASREDLVRKALEMTSDLGRLEEVRRVLRGRMQGSPLCDGAAFTAALEALYSEMWRDWCRR